MTSDEEYHPLFFRPETTYVDGKPVRKMVPYKPTIDFSMRKK